MKGNFRRASKRVWSTKPGIIKTRSYPQQWTFHCIFQKPQISELREEKKNKTFKCNFEVTEDPKKIFSQQKGNWGFVRWIIINGDVDGKDSPIDWTQAPLNCNVMGTGKPTPARLLLRGRISENLSEINSEVFSSSLSIDSFLKPQISLSDGHNSRPHRATPIDHRFDNIAH